MATREQFISHIHQNPFNFNDFRRAKFAPRELGGAGARSTTLPASSEPGKKLGLSTSLSTTRSELGTYGHHLADGTNASLCSTEKLRLFIIPNLPSRCFEAFLTLTSRPNVQQTYSDIFTVTIFSLLKPPQQINWKIGYFVTLCKSENWLDNCTNAFLELILLTLIGAFRQKF